MFTKSKTQKNTETAIKEAVSVLRNGGVVLYPTDTLYALGVDALNANAVKKLRDVKGSYKETSVAVSDIEMMRQYTNINETAERIIEKFLPGKLTLLLEKKVDLPVISGDKLGIRIPDNKTALTLVKELGSPITVTSANLSGKVTGTSVEEILQDISVDYVLDEGILEGEASTIVDLTGDEIKIQREGAISKEDLNVVLEN